MRLKHALVESLIAQAEAARRRAYAPYSRFKVGAALLLSDGRIIGGCNVENASLGLCLCAERNALTTAVASGSKDFHALAVCAQSTPPPRPCGLCLQMLAEFCVDIELLLVGRDGRRERTRLAKLLPQPFRWKGAGTLRGAETPSSRLGRSSTRLGNGQRN